MSENILKVINEIFEEVFGDEGLVLSRATTSNDIEKWDSLNNMRLVVALEKHFNIRVSLKDIQSWKNIGDLCDWITNNIE